MLVSVRNVHVHLLLYFFNISFITAVQIHFVTNAYTVRESEGSVTVCVNSTTRSFNVPLTLETLDIGTAQGMSLHALLVVYGLYTCRL